MKLEQRIVEFEYDGIRCPGEIIEFGANSFITVMIGGDKTDTIRLSYIGEDTWQTEDGKGTLEDWNYDPNLERIWKKVKR